MVHQFSSFAVLDITQWLEEDGNLNTYHPLYSFKSFNKHENFCIFVITNSKSFISQNLKAVRPLGEKFDFFIPSGTENHGDFDYITSRMKLCSVRAFKRYLNDKNLIHG